MDFLVDASAIGRKRCERQALAQALRALRRICAERSKVDRMAVKAGGDAAIRAGFERDAIDEPGG